MENHIPTPSPVERMYRATAITVEIAYGTGGGKVVEDGGGCGAS